MFVITLVLRCSRQFFLVNVKIVLYVVIFGFKGASTSQVIGARNEIMMDDYGGQMIFGDLGGPKAS